MPSRAGRDGGFARGGGSMGLLAELRGVSKVYGDAAVFAGVSLGVRPLEHLALVGPSGCGKSTLLRLIAGLEPPTSGEVWLGGRRASAPGKVEVPPHERRLAMVFQDLALWPNLSVQENVVLGLSGLRMARRERARRAMETLEMCGIATLAERKPASLSGGQLQRVALARALAVHPRLLLLDEPFTALDLTTKARIIEEIRRLCAERRVTIIMVTHDPMEATAMCPRGAVLEAGTIREEGDFRALLERPVSETLRAFLSQLPNRASEPGD